LVEGESSSPDKNPVSESEHEHEETTARLRVALSEPAASHEKRPNDAVDSDCIRRRERGSNFFSDTVCGPSTRSDPAAILPFRACATTTFLGTSLDAASSD
jgi:hypothetical protein